MDWRNFTHSLFAVVVGNAVYFAILTPILPPVARHGWRRIDLGLLIDFCVCAAIYIAVRRVAGKKKRET